MAAADERASERTRLFDGVSARRIVGFACTQAFMFFLFYMGTNRVIPVGPFPFERAELFVALLFVAAAFALLRGAGKKVRDALLARPLLMLYAALAVCGAFVPVLIDPLPPYWILVEGFAIGVPCALLFTAWGRAFGEVSTKISVPEVFFGTMLAALACLVLEFVPAIGEALLRLLPLAGAAALVFGSKPRSAADQQSPSAIPAIPAALAREEGASATALLSAKIMAGTLLFGMAAGFMKTFNTDPGAAAMGSFPTSLILLAAFSIGTLSLLGTEGFGRGAALNKAYRLAFFIMMAGYLLIPVPEFAASLVPGESVVLAGYLGLMAVLISLFLVMAKLTGADAAASFSVGFVALFAGELVGVGIANVVDLAQPAYETPYAVVVFAGALVLFSYVFLFTERDFANLSEIVTSSDTFADACRAFAEDCGLSSREGEILPYALRGRTSDRIAQELCISKSTVDTHLRRIYAKAGVHSRQELIDLGESKYGI